MTFVNLGDSVQIVYPQEEQREEDRRHGRRPYRKIIDMVLEAGDEEYGMQCFKEEFHERYELDIDQVNMLECVIRWAVEARRREKSGQKEQWRQGGRR